MRKYIVHYYAEIKDECVEREVEVEAKDIKDSIFQFGQKVKVYKRIFKIEEKIN